MITDLSLSLATLGKIFIDAGDNCGPQNVLSNLNKLRFLKAELRGRPAEHLLSGC